MKNSLIILMIFASCFLSVNCRTSPGFVPVCMKWSARSIDEFTDYVRDNGQTPMVQSVLRDAQLCAALRDISDG